MSCLTKKIIIGSFGILSLVFCSVLSSSYSYAISDFTEVVNHGSSPSSIQSVSHADFIQYKYLIITCAGTCRSENSNYRDFSFYWLDDSSGSISSSGGSYSLPGSGFNPGSVVFTLSSFQSTSSRPKFNFSSGYQNFFSNTSFDTITFTLTDHLSSDFCPSFDPPSGNLDITENGEYNVTNYATATVNVENEVIYGDYHDDLISINNSILICAAVCLVIYFFYCIYRMIIKGVK